MSNPSVSLFGLSPSQVVSRLLALVLSAVPVCTAQQPALRIVSPASGEIFYPGQTINVQVTSPANLPFKGVGVVGSGPFWLSNIATSVPAQFSFDIPSDITPGTYLFTADGATTSGQLFSSESILVDVERSGLPVRLTPSLGSLYLELSDQTFTGFPLQIFGYFSDKEVLDVTESSHLSFASSDQNVARVEKTGEVTAVAPGHGFITATYTLREDKRTVSIPVSVARNTNQATDKYNLSVTPVTQTVRAGQSVTCEVTMNPTDKFSGQEVSLRLSGFVGASGIFSLVRLTEDMRSSTLTISIAPSVPPGTYKLKVIGFDGTSYGSVGLELVVLAANEY
jgi:hypothetical protein